MTNPTILVTGAAGKTGAASGPARRSCSKTSSVRTSAGSPPDGGRSAATSGRRRID